MHILNKLARVAKRLPVDLGQGNLRHSTRAKQLAFSMVEEGGGRRALDLGAGDGFWSRRLAAKGWQVTPADSQDFRYANTVEVDAEAPLPFEDARFDLVWAAELIEHIGPVEQLVAEMRRVLRPGGRLIVTTPNSAFWLYGCLRWFKVEPRDVQNSEHKQFFAERDIRRLFPQAHVVGFFPYNVVKLAIMKHIGVLSPTFVIVEDDLTAD